MKIQKEEIIFEQGYSFKLFKPRLKNYFFWHYHPEPELIYIKAKSGLLHIGKHISDFVESKLLLIGSNLPHLNFDYAIDSDCYEKIVIQIKEDFIYNVLLKIPEFELIQKLFERSIMGLSFEGKTKKEVAKKLFAMEKKEKFDALLDLIDIFQMLAVSQDVVELNTEDTRIKLFYHDKIRMGTIYNYIHEHYSSNLSVNDAANLVHLSTAAFCRYFKKHTDMTFTEFVNHYRVCQAKTFLLQEESVADVCYKVGFESLSYFSTLFKRLTGESPSSFRNRYMKKK